MVLTLAEKHTPTKIPDVAGNEDAKARITKWALEWEQGKTPKPLLLWGQPGVGKTTLAKALACQFNWRVDSPSPFETPNTEKWKRVLRNSITNTTTLFLTKKLVLLEEVGSWKASKLRGAISSIVPLLKSPKVPIILTTSNFYTPALIPIRYLVTNIQLKAINTHDIQSTLKKISKTANIQATDAAIQQISQKCGGDIRAAINDLQAANTNASREHEKQLMETVRKCLHSQNYHESKRLSLGTLQERGTLKLYLLENIPHEFNSATSLAAAMNYVSRADVFDGRIRTKQYWGYLRYSSNLLAWGVASVKEGTTAHFVSYTFPTYLRKMGASKIKRARLKSMAIKISKKTHTSLRRARVYFPLLAAQGDLPELKNYYGLEDDELNTLIGKHKKPLKKARKKTIKS